MILGEQQLHQLFGETGYSCNFNEKKFSFLLFRDQMSPFGDIITFQSKIAVGSLHLKNSLTFCIELPNINMYGAVCFQRLFSTLLGSLLSEHFQQEIYVNEGCIFIQEKQCSISLINVVKSSSLIHIIFSKDPSNETFFCLQSNDSEIKQFQEKVVQGFYQLTKSIFLQTQHDNF